MNLPIIAQVTCEPYTPGSENSIGERPPGWGTPVTVDSHGWWEPAPEQILGVEPGRRSQEIDLALLVPTATVCADRDRWTIPGAGAFEQVAGPQDYNHGPFGMSVPLIVYLKGVRG